MPIAVEPTAYEAIDDQVLDAHRPQGEPNFEFRLYEQPEEFAHAGILSDPRSPS